MAKNNSNLHKAKEVKNDEFYTCIVDIENEMKYYKDFFKGKVVYCNCDDPKESNFFKFFRQNFLEYGLKKLITTGYKKNGHGVSYIIEEDMNGNKRIDEEEIIVTELQGDGGFESEECIAFLNEADVVVTNPPFSLFRDYIKQLIDNGKKFIVMANNNAITYKEFFPYIKSNQVWLGRTLFTGKMPYFKVSENYTLENDRYERRSDGLYKQVNGICWFTNIPNDGNREILDLFKKYNPEEYPKYDNYDAIECGRMIYLPMDYDGVIGVPITSLKYLYSDGKIHVNIDGVDTKFDIAGMAEDNGHGFSGAANWDGLNAHCVINGKNMFKRIFIKKVS